MATFRRATCGRPIFACGSQAEQLMPLLSYGNNPSRLAVRSDAAQALALLANADQDYLPEGVMAKARAPTINRQSSSCFVPCQEQAGECVCGATLPQKNECFIFLR
jgi:hypothetical protein